MFGSGAGAGVDGQYFFKRSGGGRQRAAEDGFGQARDGEERQPVRKEGRDGDFVGGVVGYGGGETGFGGAEGQRQHRVFSRIGTGEGQRFGGEVGVGTRSGGFFGVGEGVLNRNAHIRGRDLGVKGAFGGLDERMNAALRVDENLDFVGRAVEKADRFNDFQSFVGHGGGVDGNFRAHFPCRVAQRLFGGNARQVFGGSVAESASRSGNDQFADGGGIGGAPQFEKGGVFGIDGDDFGAAAGRFGFQQRAGHDDGLLIGQRQPFSAAHGFK